jgi:hypothetical protein
MKPAQLEILLFTGTRFSSRLLCEKNDTGNQDNSTKCKSLEAACWNGILPEMLPELYWEVQNRKKFILWKVTQGNHFLELEYGEQPQQKEKIFSVNPYFFMDLLLLS